VFLMRESQRKVNLWTLELVCREALGKYNHTNIRQIKRRYNLRCPPACRVSYISGSSLRCALVGLPGSLCYNPSGKMVCIVRHTPLPGTECMPSQNSIECLRTEGAGVDHGEATPF